MGLTVGIVGLPNAGKSTLFNALLRKQLAKVAEYPFTTIEPHEGAIEVADENLDRLWDLVCRDPSTSLRMIKPEKVPAVITFIDIAGLVKGAHKGEGLGNEFLSHIREVDAIVHVVRAFEHPQAQHPLGTVDPQRDIDVVNTELILKDLETVGKKLEGEKDNTCRSFLLKLATLLNQGKMVRELTFSLEETEWVGELQLLTAKPTFYVLNVSEGGLAQSRQHYLEEKDFLVVCAKLEADLTELSTAEQKEYLASVGVTESSFHKVITTAYRILTLITFFTIKGGREVRAWSLKHGETALTAAAKVHTDFARRFIRAEVIPISELLALGSWRAAHEQGKVKSHGRDYVVNDGDVIEFKIGN